GGAPGRGAGFAVVGGGIDDVWRLIGIAVPDGGVLQAPAQGRAQQGVVEAAGLGVVDVGVGPSAIGGDQGVVPAGIDEAAHGIFHGIGVEVAQHRDQIAAAAGRVAGKPGAQRRARCATGGVEAGLAVALVEVGAGGVAAALGLEVVG